MELSRNGGIKGKEILCRDEQMTEDNGYRDYSSNLKRVNKL